jgi:diguanylate cyclase (GGDEF)-like protein
MGHTEAAPPTWPRVVLEYDPPRPAGAKSASPAAGTFRLRNAGNADAFHVRVARIQRRFGNLSFEPVPQISAGSIIGIQPGISAGDHLQTFEQVLIAECDVFAAEFAKRSENIELIGVPFQIDYQDSAGESFKTQMEMQYDCKRGAADWLRQVSGGRADSCNARSSYNPDLADAILRGLHESGPAELQMDSLRQIAPRYVNLAAGDWIKTIDVLIQIGYVYGQGVQRDQQDNLLRVSGIGITTLGGFLFDPLERNGGVGEEHLDVLLPIAPKSQFKVQFDVCAKLASQGEAFSLLIMDVDRYSHINMTCGHEVGDRALIEVASKVKAVCEGKGRCSRWAGGAIAVLLPRCGLSEARALAERVRQAVSLIDMFKLERCPNQATVSIGVASCPETNPTVDRVIGDAQEAMYAAKTGGRNRVTCASGSRRVSDPFGNAHQHTACE